MIEKIKKIAKKLWNFLKEIEERKTTLGFIACALVLSFGIVIPNNTSVSEERDRQGNNQNTKSLERTEGMFVEKCDFNDLNNWLGIENFEIEKDDIFKPKLSENFPNSREMFCDEKIGMNFSLPIKFTPLNENRINLSINYGYLWRIIIGNNDYKQIQIQLNDKYLSEDKERPVWKDIKEGRFWLRPRGLTQLKQIKATIMSKISDVSDKKINVSIYISGVSNLDDTEKEWPPFSIDLPLPKDNKDLLEKIGVGILGTEKEGARIQLEEFKLQELNSLN